MKELDVGIIRKLFSYDCESGILFWKVKLNRSIRIGAKAGTINKYNKYLIVTIDKKKYMAHRIIWAYVYGFWPKNHIDHINHIRSDNKLLNLREATSQENSRNASIRKDNTSGIAGVNLVKPTNKWGVFIKPYDKNLYLGSYDDFFEACCARLSASNKYGFHNNHGRDNIA